MFSSIEPCAPRGRTFPATFSPLFVPQARTRIPAISYQPMIRQLARVLPTASQSAPCSLPLFMLAIAVDPHLQFSQLREASVYFPTPSPLCITIISLPLPLSYRALFCRPPVYICFICYVIPGTSTVPHKRFCNHILVVVFSNKRLGG